MQESSGDRLQMRSEQLDQIPDPQQIFEDSRNSVAEQVIKNIEPVHKATKSSVTIEVKQVNP